MVTRWSSVSTSSDIDASSADHVERRCDRRREARRIVGIGGPPDGGFEPDELLAAVMPEPPRGVNPFAR